MSPAGIPAFEFATSARIVFGVGTAARLAELVAEHGERVLVCTGSRPDRHADLLGPLAVVAEYRVAGEPTVQMIAEATTIARKADVDVVVGIGGGSVLDTAKAVAMLLGNGGGPMDYLEVIGAGRPITAASVPMIAVPTTSGTGAEVTANAVLASTEHARKVSVRARSMLPAVALVDPALTVDCPPGVTAAGGMDALTQCLEPLVSAAATPLSDALAADGLQRCARSLRTAYRNGTDLHARTDLSLGSLLGGMALANAKLGAVHGFAGVIGGMVTAPHGAVCAALLAPVVAANLAAMRSRSAGRSDALDRFDRVAQLLTGDPTATADDAVPFLRTLTADLGIPGLGSYGVTADLVDRIVAATATASSTKGNPIELTAGELRECLLAAL